MPWSGHLLPVRDNNRKWLTRLQSRTPLLACGNADGIVHNNTVHVRRHRVSKYTTLTKSCFVLRKQDMNPQEREKACPSFSLRLLCDQRRDKHATRLLEAYVRSDDSFKYLSAYMGLWSEPHTRKVPLESTLNGHCVKGRTVTFSCSRV